MFDVRNWERFQFLLDCEHQTVIVFHANTHQDEFEVDACAPVQNKTILQRALPPYLKLSIARTIENNLFSKVLHRNSSPDDPQFDFVFILIFFQLEGNAEGCLQMAFFFRFPFSLDLQESAKFGPCLRQRSSSFKLQYRPFLFVRHG